MNARHELAREAEAIMYDAGCVAARAQHWGAWWTVYGKLANDDEMSGHTAEQTDPQDPRDLARRLAAKLVKPAPAPEFENIPEAPETVEPTFAPGDDPLDPAPEAAETPEHETHGETGEAGEEHSALVGIGEAGVEPSGHGGEGVFAEDAGTPVNSADDRLAHPISPNWPDDQALDAEFTVPALETIELIEPGEPDFGGDLLEFERETQEPPAAPEPPLDRFIGLDDLDRRRSLRMGDVMRYARSIMPTWGVEQDAELAGLRNFAMGVSEGRWADDPAKRDTLDALEATLRRIRQIETARDQRVEFLEAATREEVEAFVVEADWP